MGKQDQMTDEEVSILVARVSDETARKVVDELLITLGIDTKNPMEMQADMQHLRAWRNSVDTIKRQGLLSATVVIILGVLGLIWTAVANNHPTP